MSKYTEALTYFKHRLDCGQCGKETTQRFAFEEAIKALEKQIPKKPKIEHYTNRIMSEQVVYICPNCGDSWNENEYLLDYCWECGQRLDWNEVEIDDDFCTDGEGE